jgi:hypothetical protein
MNDVIVNISYFVLNCFLEKALGLYEGKNIINVSCYTDILTVTYLNYRPIIFLVIAYQSLIFNTMIPFKN